MPQLLTQHQVDQVVGVSYQFYLSLAAWEASGGVKPCQAFIIQHELVSWLPLFIRLFFEPMTISQWLIISTSPLFLHLAHVNASSSALWTPLRCYGAGISWLIAKTWLMTWHHPLRSKMVGCLRVLDLLTLYLSRRSRSCLKNPWLSSRFGHGMPWSKRGMLEHIDWRQQ